MSNSKILFLKNTILGGAFLFLVVCSLASCENFLKGSDIKKDLENNIAYNNAEVVNVDLVCPQEMGKIFPASTYSARIGFEFEVQFIPNTDDYVLKNPAKVFEAVSRKDNTVSLNDYVEFTAVTQTEEDKKDGLYRAKVKILKKSDDIQIQPGCYEVPAIKSHTPETSVALSYANIPIVIQFNMPMESPDVTSEQTLFNYDNILLTYGTKKVSEYFNAPVFNDDKTELKLIPKWQELMNYIKKENVGSMLIDVSFTDKIVVAREGVELTIKNKGIAFSVNYVPVVETTPPEQYDYFVTRHEITLEDVQTIADEDKFHFESLSVQGSMSSEEFGNLLFQNATNGIVYIYGRFYDKDSGVQSVVVTHRRIQKKDGTNVGEQEWKTVYKKGSAGTEFITQNNETRFCIMHKLDNGKNGEKADGAYILNVEVKDACENTANAYDKTDTRKQRKTITAIKKSGFYGWMGSGIINNGAGFYGNVISGTTFNEDDYREKIKNLYLYMIFENYEDDAQALFGKENDIYYLPETFTIECEYIDKSGKPTKGTFNLTEESEETEPEWNLRLDVDSVSGLEVLVRVKDILGNVDERTFRFPSKDEEFIVEMTKAGNNIDVKRLYRSQSGAEITNWRLIDSDNNLLDKQFTFNPQKTYSIIWKGTFYGEKVDIDFTSEVGTNIDKVQINEPYLEKSSTEGVLNCIIPLKMESNPWNYYDLIKVIYCYQESYINSSTFYITKGNTFASFSFEDHNIYETYSNSHPWYIQVYGLKNHVWSEAVEKIVNMITESEEQDSQFISLDNSAPWISLNYKGGSVVIYTDDYESGIKSASLKLLNGKNNGKGEELQFDEDYKCEIPTYKLLPVSTEPIAFEFEIIDKGDNIQSGEYDYFKESFSKEYDSITILEPTAGDGSVRIKEKISINIDSTPTLYGFAYDETKHSFPVSLNNSISLERSEIAGSLQYEHEAEYTIAKSELSKVSSTYVKIVPRDTGGTISWFTPFYCYNGAPGTGENDFLMQNDNSTDSVVICSDKPVFVHTAVSEMPYEVCKTWGFDEWEYFKLSLNEKILDFGAPTQQDPNKNLPKRYVIPVEQMKTGDSYVVIAHFSDNHVEMSRVMQVE